MKYLFAVVLGIFALVNVAEAVGPCNAPVFPAPPDFQSCLFEPPIGPFLDYNSCIEAARTETINAWVCCATCPNPIPGGELNCQEHARARYNEYVDEVCCDLPGAPTGEGERCEIVAGPEPELPSLVVRGREDNRKRNLTSDEDTTRTVFGLTWCWVDPTRSCTYCVNEPTSGFPPGWPNGEACDDDCADMYSYLAGCIAAQDYCDPGHQNFDPNFCFMQMSWAYSTQLTCEAKCLELFPVM